MEEPLGGIEPGGERVALSKSSSDRREHAGSTRMTRRAGVYAATSAV
jgi:hypothetical protein